MIPILVVGDGARDGVVLPPMLARIIGRAVRCEFRPWSRLHGSGRGYQRKLRFALEQARDLGMEGLVAAVDADVDADSREKLRALWAGREEDRAKRPFLPAGLGCAVPHSEAWLITDQDAVRRALGIPATEAIPKSKYPKDALNELMKKWKPDIPLLDLLVVLASEVDPDRQAQKDATGYLAFVTDVREEFKAYRVSTS